MEKRSLLLILLILGTVFWGISFSVTKLAMGSQTPAIFLFYRFLLATIVLSMVFWKYVKNIDLASIRTGALLAIPLFFGIHLQTLGIKYTNASQSAFIAGMCVVIVPLLKLIVYRKALAVKVWVAAFIALLGLATISITSQFTIRNGDLYNLTGAVFFAIYLVVVEKKAVTKSLVSTIVPMFATCTLLTFIFAAADQQVIWLPEDAIFWKGIVYCALFSTAFMYTVSNIAQRYISAEKVAIIYLFEPIFGAIAAFFILGEDLSWRLIMGGSLIFAATVISEIDLRKVGFLKKVIIE